MQFVLQDPSVSPSLYKLFLIFCCKQTYIIRITMKMPIMLHHIVLHSIILHHMILQAQTVSGLNQIVSICCLPGNISVHEAQTLTH